MRPNIYRLMRAKPYLRYRREDPGTYTLEATGQELGKMVRHGDRWLAYVGNSTTPITQWHQSVRFFTRDDAAEAILTRADRQCLYGLPGAEEMYYDPSEVIEDFEWTGDPEQDSSLPSVIEEWSVREPREHLPSVDRLLEWISEWTADSGEISDAMDLIDVVKRTEVIDAAEHLLTAIACAIPWRMAGRKLRDLPVTWAEMPLIDGVPAWVTVDTTIRDA